MAYIAPDELDDDKVQPEVRNELARARRLVSPEFVIKMKQKFKDLALQRMEAEKEVRSQQPFPTFSLTGFQCSPRTLSRKMKNAQSASMLSPTLS